MLLLLIVLIIVYVAGHNDELSTMVVFSCLIDDSVADVG